MSRPTASLAGLAVTWVPQLSVKSTNTIDLNVRSGPGKTHAKVGSIKVGSTDRYNILGKDAATAGLVRNPLQRHCRRLGVRGLGPDLR